MANDRNGSGVATFIEPTHNREVCVFVDQVVAVTIMPTFKSTVIVGPGSTAIPVIGTVQEVTEKIAAIKRAMYSKGEANGF